MAAVFPDAAACLENIPGDRQIPDHPLVAQTIRDCLEEAMDFDGLAAVLERIHGGDFAAWRATRPSRRRSRTRSSTPGRTRSWTMRRSRSGGRRRSRRGAPASRRGRRPGRARRGRHRARARRSAADPRDADELHDALLTAGFLTRRRRAAQCRRSCSIRWSRRGARRSSIQRFGRHAERFWVAAERLPEFAPSIPTPRRCRQSPRRRRVRARVWTRDEAIVELLRGRLTIVGPTTARALADSLAIDEADADAALLALEWEGVVLRGTLHAVRVQPPSADRTTASGATAGCSHASTATRSTACAPRSSRSARPTSCGSCLRGSTSHPPSRLTGRRRPARRDRRARRLRARRRRVGARRSCRRGSTATSRRCSTCCA